MKTHETMNSSIWQSLFARTAALSLSVAAALSASAQGVTYPGTILSNNPVAYYQLQELPGATTAVDSSTNGFNATRLRPVGRHP